MVKEGEEMRAALEALDIGQTELARWLETTDRSVRHYVAGERPMPPGLGLLLEYLQARPEAVQWFKDRAERMKEASSEGTRATRKAQNRPRRPKKPEQMR